MKRKNPKNKRGATAAAIVAGMTLATAMFAPSCNSNECVYGPPPTDDSDYKPTANSNECVYGPPSSEAFDPGNNQNEDVYGPPEFFDGAADESDT